MQFVPEVQPVAGHLTGFQRTPPWVLHRRDRALSRVERRLYRMCPGAQRLARAAVHWGRELWSASWAPRWRRRALSGVAVAGPEAHAGSLLHRVLPTRAVDALARHGQW